ncbi:bifunctional 3-deoxy-7-phosphoheptulonate synthase/chorismate mutase [Paenibacillus alvei]|uniref:bifunctional 3-deoxy-7-phosphoheptulonate synthase/chorismate mutase n=1 Tax=Paenibacillus alvei TaxID=44250 RepID=UPI0021CEA037|nr:bifunctional 3-deoxy-7-phosphoheptulonate synthase/chorismate mutase [Paenibacillus alvei]MCY9540581.1 bifunctional 3-deoxy-7-phosphoheptulonate synthase/chorismate mutase [Paenibacillus alvei]MCY9706982.1 bifunctional 3-deoxy-7-phosphoheptulonate synthase/chorismate mutase [Paenibacillus alvei]MCY9736048.1 bifunctional 3-deoxy-7-phosphoheptulonate synthase/chorismate mutase [Paenibacillus alvei]MCY9755888.1 bifunctional 3-deoxy-7-phosphoheptulonate synthase/chorismate mutase [Paenibacillus 
MSDRWKQLITQWDGINQQLLDLMNERARMAAEIVQEKNKQGISQAEPVGNQQLLNELATLTFASEIKKEAPAERKLLVSRRHKSEDTIIQVKHAEIGGSSPVIVAGPCSIESRDQLLTVATAMRNAGITVLRGGAYKPRTSPYDFQGLGEAGLKIMKEVADETGMVTISEIMSPMHIDMAARYIDIFQIGARNMHNFDLLKAVGQTQKPVLLKRGLSATLEEFVFAAEYLLSSGNNQVMLIERGIRTYERWTRNTLDISAVPILTHLPVLVDVTHATGRKDIMLPCAKAALAAGADGIMVEVHPNPRVALSDAKQQLNIDEFHKFLQGIRDSGLYR